MTQPENQNLQNVGWTIDRNPQGSAINFQPQYHLYFENRNTQINNSSNIRNDDFIPFANQEQSSNQQSSNQQSSNQQ
jgi:hypothetical protein